MDEKKKILIIDDEPEIIQTVKMILEAENYSVLATSDGMEGLRLADTLKPDLVILDLRLPKMPGIGVLGALRERKASPKIPVIILAGSRDSEVFLKDFDVQEFLLKPVDKDRLLRNVHRILNPPAKADAFSQRAA